MAARRLFPSTPPRGRRAEYDHDGDDHDDGYAEESKTPSSGYSTPPQRRSRGKAVLWLCGLCALCDRWAVCCAFGAS
jgi:hypothetical protein